MTKIKLWTRQHENILDDLSEKGVYHVKERYIRRKLGDIASFYLDVYSWYRHKASEKIKIPEKANYPIWLSTSADMKLPLAGNNIMLELSIPENKVIILDMVKWDYVVNYWYIPKNKADAKKHKNLLKRYGIKSESSIYMEDFYPRLKEKIVNSWDRIFNNEIKLSDKKVATVWEIKEEWIDDIKYSEKDNNSEGG